MTTALLILAGIVEVYTAKTVRFGRDGILYIITSWCKLYTFFFFLQ